MGVRSAVYVDHRRIFLRRVEVGWLHHAVVKVRYPIGRLDASAFEERLLVAFPWILGSEQLVALSFSCGYHLDVPRDVGSRVFVDHLFTCGRELGRLHGADAFVE